MILILNRALNPAAVLVCLYHFGCRGLSRGYLVLSLQINLLFAVKFINLEKKVWQWLLLILLAFIWGASFILMKRGLTSFSNMQVGAMRVFFAFIFYIPLIIANLKKLNRYNLKPLLKVGFIGNAIPAFLFATAQTEISSSLAGILNSLTPIFTLVVGLIFYSSRVRLINTAGLTLGLAGAVGLVISINSMNTIRVNDWYAIFVVLATIGYGINVNEIKYKLTDLDGVAIASLGFLFIGPVAGTYLLFSDFSEAVNSPVFRESLFAVSTLAFLASFLAIILINILIKYTTAIFAASVTYIIPIFAVFWGVMDGEMFGIIQVIWSAVILFGVYMVNMKKNLPVIKS